MKASGKITSTYALTALTWILFSDQALQFISQGEDTFVTFWQSIKGVLFVMITATVLYLVVRYYLSRIEAAQKEKREIFHSTLDTTAIILNNFLNDMIYFRMVAEDSPFIEQSVLHEYDRVIRETSAQLRRLADLEDVTPVGIRTWLEQDEGHYYCPLPEKQ